MVLWRLRPAKVMFGWWRTTERRGLDLRKEKTGATVDAPESSITTNFLAVIAECEDREGLGCAAAAGDLHCPLSGQWIASNVLSGCPDLRQKVLVAIPVEHQPAVR